jgi:hypothetical protein
VSAFVPWDGPQFKHDATPLAVERHDRKKAKQQRLEEAYAVVDQRDGNRCRATGVSLVAGDTDPRKRREHHHLVPRSRSQSGREDDRNICLLSALVHGLVTRGWITVEGVDARKPLFFHYTALATSRPIQLKRHNKVAVE